MNEPLSRLTGVFRSVFDDDEMVVTRATSARDVPGWDSLMHVTLLVNVEKEFGIRLTSSEVAGFKTVGELEDLLRFHLNGSG